MREWKYIYYQLNLGIREWSVLPRGRFTLSETAVGTSVGGWLSLRMSLDIMERR
jgi:hypothetical protein